MATQTHGRYDSVSSGCFNNSIGLCGWHMLVRSIVHRVIGSRRQQGKWDGILDHMAHVFGQSSFNSGSQATRFQAILNGNSALSTSMLKVYMKMRREVHGEEALDHLPMDSPFKNGPEWSAVKSRRVPPQHEFTASDLKGRE